MPSHQPARLTKKQKKASAFRERGSSSKSKGIREGKGKPNPAPAPPTRRPRRRPSTGDNGEEDDDEDANAVPAMEDQDQTLAEMAQADEGQNPWVPKSTLDSAVAQKKKQKNGGEKRNRSTAEDGEAGRAAKKARLARSSGEVPPLAREQDKVRGGAAGVVKDSEGGEGSETNDKGSKTQRYILFVGNLKYTTTREAIQNHFSHCDPPPTVRLLTPKHTRAGATVAKSKGCAFIEFSTRPALQAALRMHQSELEGRQINVELTAGGGGKGDARLAKVKTRNKLLTAQRARRTLKAETVHGPDTAHQSVQPQRFSTTSGEGDVPRTKRTWTVNDGDQNVEHRGCMKARKKRGTRTKNWGTGVNALPIG